MIPKYRAWPLPTQSQDHSTRYPTIIEPTRSKKTKLYIPWDGTVHIYFLTRRMLGARLAPARRTVDACRIAASCLKLDAWRTAAICLMMAGVPEPVEERCLVMEPCCPIVDFWYGSCPRTIALESTREAKTKAEQRSPPHFLLRHLEIGARPRPARFAPDVVPREQSTARGSVSPKRRQSSQPSWTKKAVQCAQSIQSEA